MPKDLNVPDKGQDDFKKAFGLSWKDAVKQGKVLNASQACKVRASLRRVLCFLFVDTSVPRRLSAAHRLLCLLPPSLTPQTLGINGNDLDGLWSKLKRGKDLIKFGGGFYCGQIGDKFVING